MTAHLFGLLLSLTGILGIGGMVALFIFAPPLAVAILRGAGNLATAVVATRLGLGLTVGIAGLLLGWFGGAWHAESACTAQIAMLRSAADAAAAKRDADLRTALEQQYQPVIDKLRDDAATLKAQADADAEALDHAAAPTACPLGDGPLRLRRRAR